MADASNRTLTIYGLVDPAVPGDIRYVGATTQALHARANRHRAGARAGEPSPKADWVRSVLARGVLVRAVPLQENADEGAEARWIETLLATGADLLNAREGGLSGFRCFEDTRVRMGEAQKVNQNRPEVKTRNRATNQLTHSKPEVRARMEAIRSTTMARPDVRAKMRASAKARWERPEEREKLSAACKGRKLDRNHPFLIVRRGEANPSALLTEHAVREIRALCAARQRHADVAAKYGVSRSLIGAIHRREVWKEVA